MKRLAILVLLVLSGCAAAPKPTPVPPSPVKDWSITATWSYDFTNFPICSAAVTKGCIMGFTWGYNGIPLKTSPASVCSGTTQPEACTDTANGILGIGTVIPYVQANAIDNNGNAIVSPVDLAPPDNIPPGAANGLGWSRK